MPKPWLLLRSMLSLRRDEFAGVTILIALALPAILGATGLAFDLNRGYQQRVINQRAADLGALGAALAYKATGNATVLTPTAQDIARANGLAGATVSAGLVADYPVAGQQSVRVTVEQSVPVTLGRLVGSSASYPVRARATASLASPASTTATPCYLALSNEAEAVTVNGGASIVATLCAVAAVGGIANKGTLIQGTEIISGSGSVSVLHGALLASKIHYAQTFSAPAWNLTVPLLTNRIKGPTTLVDPWGSDITRVAAMALLGHYDAPPALTNPVTPAGTDWTFDYSPKAPTKAFETASGKFTVPAGTHNIKKLTIAGGVEVTFANGAIITVNDGVSIGGGSKVNFGNSDVYVNGGFNSGSSGVTFGDGLLWIGSGRIDWEGTNRKGKGDVLINDTLKLGGGQHLRVGDGNHYFRAIDLGNGGTALMGAGKFVAAQGVAVGGDSELAIGNGDIVIGPGNANRAIFLNGSGRFIMGDGAFSANGNVETLGGSRLIFGKTANHYIKGNVNIGGAALFGAGRYTIDGDLENGTGGTTWPFASSLTGLTYGNLLDGVATSLFDMAGVNVTFILKGTVKLAGGAKTLLLAPTTTQTGGGIAELLLSSASTADANWTGGAINTFGGTVHLPNAQVKMGGGNVTLSGMCMSLIASSIRVTGGAVTGSACLKMQNVGGSTTTGSSIRLVA